MRPWNALLVLVVAVAVAPVSAQRAADPARVAPGHACTAIRQANVDASAGTVNINRDGTPIAGMPAPDISRGFSGIPRASQPPLTASQQRILECTHRLAEANASRRAVAALQAVGAPHIYLEFPDKDHEFWIRRGAAQMEKVFLFFSLISKRTTVLPQK